MGVEILGADITPKQIEVTEGNTNFPTEMDGKSQELDEPTKSVSVESSNRMNGKVKEADNIESSNVPKDAVDEWPAPRQIHTFYLIRVRPYEDLELKLKIEKADIDLRQKIDQRSEIIGLLRGKKTKKAELKSELFSLLDKNKIHNMAMDEKREEIEPVRKNLQAHREANNVLRERGMGLCSSEEELNDRIRSLHYRMQHESNTLNEEKQLLKEIKRLEASREDVIINAARKAEIEKSKGKKAEDQEQMKKFGDDMDEIRKKKQDIIAGIKQLDGEVKGVESEIASLEEKLKSCTAKRDKAYETLTSLRKARDEVNACFYQNRSLLNNAKELAAKKDIEGLEALSNSEVEKFMSQWNSNKGFRDDYERRILTSLNSRQLSRDGRMRNPNEKPIIVETPPAAKLEPSPAAEVTPKQGKEAIKLPPSEDLVSANKTRSEELTKPSKADGGRKISGMDEMGKALQDEQPQESSKSKEIDPAKLKEMKREEELAKAKLAMERKKKLAEKAAAKAAARAQKEAEKKLKQKEKKAKKKAGTTEPELPSEETETETKTAEAEEADVKSDIPVSEASKEQKVNVRYRTRTKVPSQLPRVILKRKKSHSYLYWAAPGAILALVLAVVAGFYSFGRM